MSGVPGHGTPPLIGVSACLLGERVRYDGGHKLARSLLDRLGDRVRWLPICPEVEAGFGVPRPPMQLEEDGHAVKLIGIESRRDFTKAMRGCARILVSRLANEGLSGFVLKNRSPSCGSGDAPLVDRSGARIAVRDGMFAAALREALPGLPLASREDLESASGQEAFLAAAAAYKSAAGDCPPQ